MHRRLRRRRRSLGHVVSSASSANASLVAVESLGSYSSADASIVVVNCSVLSSRRRSLCRRHQIFASSVVVSDPLDASSIPCPLPTSPSLLSIPRASQHDTAYSVLVASSSGALYLTIFRWHLRCRFWYLYPVFLHQRRCFEASY